MLKQRALSIAIGVALGTSVAFAAPQVTVKVTGQPEVVYSYTQDQCNKLDVPDNPARAFQNASGQNVLVFGNSHGYYYTTTPTLGAPLTRDCGTSILNSAGIARNSDPSSYYNALWIIATWTQNGNDVYALVHNEYHPTHGPSDNGMGYWNMVSAVSHNGGKTFQLNTYPNATNSPIPAIATPLQYQASAGGLQGLTA